MRKNTQKDENCVFHNKNIIEAVIDKDIIKVSQGTNVTNEFVVDRFIYNRSNYQYSDLVTLYETIENEKKVNEITIRMLSDNESKKIRNGKCIKKDTVFNETFGYFKIIEHSVNDVEIQYSYSSKTDHWLLNKSIAVSQVYDGMKNGFTNLFNSLSSTADQTKTVSKN